MFLQLRVVLSLDFRKSRSFLQRAPQVFLVESSVNIGCFREPLPFLYVHKSQKLCFQSSVNIGCFSEPPTIVGIRSPHHFFREPPTFLQLRVASILDVLGSPRQFSRFTRLKFFFQGAPNNFWSREPPSLLQGVPMFLQLRVELSLDFRKPPSFLQGAPNILYLRVASILDVLGSPRHFSSFTRVKRFVCREPPTNFGTGSPHHF